jgi:hypothetical protein
MDENDFSAARPDSGLLALRIGVGLSFVLLFALKQSQGASVFIYHPGRVWPLLTLSLGALLVVFGFHTRLAPGAVVWAGPGLSIPACVEVRNGLLYPRVPFSISYYSPPWPSPARADSRSTIYSAQDRACRPPPPELPPPSGTNQHVRQPYLCSLIQNEITSFLWATRWGRGDRALPPLNLFSNEVS